MSKILQTQASLMPGACFIISAALFVRASKFSRFTRAEWHNVAASTHTHIYLYVTLIPRKCERRSLSCPNDFPSNRDVPMEFFKTCEKVSYTR